MAETDEIVAKSRDVLSVCPLAALNANGEDTRFGVFRM